MYEYNLLDYKSSHCSLKHVIDNIDNIMTNVESNPVIPPPFCLVLYTIPTTNAIKIINSINKW